MTKQFANDDEMEFVNKLVPLIFRSLATTSAIELESWAPGLLRDIEAKLTLVCNNGKGSCRFDESYCSWFMIVAAMELHEFWVMSPIENYRPQHAIVSFDGHRRHIVAETDPMESLIINDPMYETTVDTPENRVFKFFLRSGLKCAEIKNAEALAERLKWVLDMTWLRRVGDIDEISRKWLTVKTEDGQAVRIKRPANYYLYKILELYVLATLARPLEGRLVTQNDDGVDVLLPHYKFFYRPQVGWLAALGGPGIRIDIGGYNFFYGGDVQGISKSLGCKDIKNLWGLPDIVLVTPSGKTFVIEIKLRGSSNLNIIDSARQVSFHAEEFRRCIKEVVPIVAFYKFKRVNSRGVRKSLSGLEKLGVKFVELMLDGTEEELSSIILSQ